MEVIEYSDVLEAIKDTPKRHLILGNGFSISLSPKIFTYGSLFKKSGVIDHVKFSALFKSLDTEDLELVIKHLVSAAKIIRVYEGSDSKTAREIESDANELKEILAESIARHHPAHPFEITDDQYISCRQFLSEYQNKYTLNYDVLLYWTLMRDELDKIYLHPDDGFRHNKDEPDAPWVTWQQAHSPSVYNLHGALHLFDMDSKIVKYTWSRTDVPILSQIKKSLDSNKYPIFVSEGTSESKRARILHNAYLHKALRSLESCADNSKSVFVIYGHSLDPNDDHILSALERGKVPTIYVSIYGDVSSPANKAIAKRAEKMIAERLHHNSKYPLNVVLFDAASAHVWG